MSIYHTHHIIPKHMGGTDDPSNLIRLSLEEHAEAHRKLWEEYGHKQDFYAWKGLSGSMGKEEIIIGLISHPGESNPFYGKKHTPETKRKMSVAKKGKYLGENNPLYGRKNLMVTERNKKGHSAEIRLKMSEKRKGRIWIRKGNEQTHIPPEKLNDYLNLGWVRGRLPVTDSQKQKISKTLTGNPSPNKGKKLGPMKEVYKNRGYSYENYLKRRQE